MLVKHQPYKALTMYINLSTYHSISILKINIQKYRRKYIHETKKFFNEVLLGKNS